ncbi:hypothetical protein [Ideonella sp. A 288]|uniref:hypothetical protein n=1 Tax=Ideonella sp. A 288 TaxID=1962181 RepID=UPI001185A7D5|nr:hypothetical protein [Ideonella sp. A 288]
MSSASMSFGRPTRITIPRGSLWFANMAAALINGIRRIDRWQLAHRQNEPQTPEEVLAWASRIEASDPSFAADLRGAVQRSNSQSGH